jgi:hypothetical protein
LLLLLLLWNLFIRFGFKNVIKQLFAFAEGMAGDDIKMGLQEIGIGDVEWTDLAQDTDKL